MSNDNDGPLALDSMEPLPTPQLEHFPMCLVWCPIPLLTWLFPFIGHVGIVTSNGVIHDFAGPYFVNVCWFSLQLMF